MPTNELLNKLKEQKATFQSIKNVNIGAESFAPLFSVVGAILKTKSLIDEGISPGFGELLLPHLVTTFGPMLIANSIYPRFKFTPKDLVIYAIGFILSLFIYPSSFLMFFLKEVPHFAKFFSLVKIKNSPEDTFLMFCWILTSDIAGNFLTRSILKKKLEFDTKELTKMVVMYGGVLFLRKFHMSDYYVIIVASIIPLSFKAYEYLKTARPSKPKQPVKVKEEKRKVVIQPPPIRKAVTKRKAAVLPKTDKK